MKIRSFNLPAKYRLELKVVKRRKNLEERPLLLRLGDLRRVRKGSRISRFVCHLFEHKRTRQFVGTNLAIVAVAGSFVPTLEVGTSPNNIEVVNSVNTNFATERNVQYPTANSYVNQGYTFYHPAIDFEGDYGDEIRPFKNGVVAEVGYSKLGYGNAVLIDHGGGLSSLYAHLTAIYVAKDQVVDTNFVIGTVGSTGRSTGTHLHFEIREDGKQQNPFVYLPR